MPLANREGICKDEEHVFMADKITLELEKRELRKRQNVPRNKQLLNTIAPRTNVDRTWQMADGPPSPALRSPG